MIIYRAFKATYIQSVVALMRQSVMTQAQGYYTDKQLDAWVNSGLNIRHLFHQLMASHTIMVFDGRTLIAFGNIFDDGYLDCLYVDEAYQHKGIGKRLLHHLESMVDTDMIHVDAAINAMPFFINQGYLSQKENRLLRNGVVMTNIAMAKPWNPH